MTTATEEAQTINPLAATDPEIDRLIRTEAERQEYTLEMIASENHVSAAVMAAVGSCLTNKYCEGYPKKRYYSGCNFYDQIEQIAIDRATELFGCKYANVQPHSGANANNAVFFAMLQPGDTFLSVELSEGGHLSHGAKVNISGKWFNPVHYPLVKDPSRDDDGYIDFEKVEAIALEQKPKLILCGYSAYPRTVDFERFRAIADKVGALLMSDVSHVAGLIVGGQHPSPFPHSHIVTTTTHKTLRGPRGGLILTDDEDLATKMNKAIFPGTQGGPLMHVIAGKAVAFGEALKPDFKDYAAQIVKNAKKLAAELTKRGFGLCSGGTDNHLMLIDLRKTDEELTGKDAANWLEEAGIIVNKNGVPGDSRSPFVTSGVRIGTPALTTRGMKEDDMVTVAALIDKAIQSKGDKATLDAVRNDVVELCKQYPMPH